MGVEMGKASTFYERYDCVVYFIVSCHPCYPSCGQIRTSFVGEGND